jgi:hypothetical protein
MYIGTVPPKMISVGMTADDFSRKAQTEPHARPDMISVPAKAEKRQWFYRRVNCELQDLCARCAAPRGGPMVAG